MAAQRVPDLLGRLKEGSSGLVNWALSAPKEWGPLGQCVDEINGGWEGGVDACGIHGWLFDRVGIQPGKEIPLGATKIPRPGSIYESYVDHAEMNGFEPMSCYKFGEVLLDSLRSRGHRNVEVKRMNYGRVVKGLTLDQAGRPTQVPSNLTVLLCSKQSDGIELPNWMGERRELNPRVMDPQTIALIHLATSAPSVDLVGSPPHRT